MTAQEIKDIIDLELRSEADIHHVFGLDMTKCLIEPIKQKYRCANNSNNLYELWTVLEETRDADGYRIYYDENTEMFGLAIQSNKDVLIDIGSYGTFLKALYSM